MTRSTRAGLVRLGHGCWVPPEVADDLAGRCLALLDHVAPDSVITSVTAARLHGAWLPNLPNTLHVATASPDRVGRAMSRSRRNQVVAHRLQLEPQDVMVLGGVPILTPARTWRDLADSLSLPDLVAAGDSILRMGAAPEDLADVVRRTGGRRGSARARAALPLLDARSRSRPESHLRVAISAPDLPRFEVNVPVFRAEGGWLAEPDLSLADAKLALEYQGEDHARLDRMRADITRGRDLRMDGWAFLAFGPAEVFGRPWTIAPEVRSLVLERAPHLIRATRRRGRHIARVVR